MRKTENWGGARKGAGRRKGSTPSSTTTSVYVLDKQLAQINALVEAGEYASKNAFFKEAIGRLLAEHQQS